MTSLEILTQPVGIIGSGIAGLINAHVLLQDGFTDVTLISKDVSVGGVWARERVYPGLHINNVHGEYRFSSLDMPPPERSESTGGLTGIAMRDYMETFSKKFLDGKAKFQLQRKVLDIRRVAMVHDGEPSRWNVKVQDLRSDSIETLTFARIILATGGCSNPKIPEALSSRVARSAGYLGLVFHTSDFFRNLDYVLEQVGARTKESELPNDTDDRVVVIGGGKSAQDVCAKLANEGRRVTIVFDRTDTFLASTAPPPDFGRKSRLSSVLLPHRVLRTRLEKFLHKTWIGSKIVHWLLDFATEQSFKAYNIAPDSPFRRTHSLFWGVRLSDDGVVRNDSFYSLVNAGLIDVAAPHRAVGYSSDGRGIVLDDDSTLPAKVVVLATGYQSSWSDIFSDETINEIGFGKHAPTLPIEDKWKYTTTSNAPQPHPDSHKWTTTIYRGIVPAKNILNRDFAIAGAMFSANPGYTNEVVAHWISSYFQNDKMKIPKTTEQALIEAETESIWMKVRFPDMLSWVNDSYSTSLDFWTWPQAADDLLDDMYLPIWRSGGNWLTWPFKTVGANELATLGEERKALRSG